MCLATVARVVSVDDEHGTAVVDAGGRHLTISLAPIVLTGGRVEIGEWVLLHTGLAVAVVTEAQARELAAPATVPVATGGIGS